MWVGGWDWIRISKGAPLCTSLLTDTNKVAGIYLKFRSVLFKNLRFCSSFNLTRLQVGMTPCALKAACTRDDVR